MLANATGKDVFFHNICLLLHITNLNDNINDLFKNRFSKCLFSLCLFSDLQPWTLYRVRVQAFTTQVSNGFGPFTEMRSARTLQDGIRLR